MNDMVRIPKVNGGPAFAKAGVQGRCVEDNEPGSDGMSLRDYFAAQAIAGFAHAPRETPAGECASYAYLIADAMLKARSDTMYDLVPRREMED